MKCDELKVHKAYNRWIDEEMPTHNDDLICNEVYLKDEVDAAIAELKEKLEDAKATAYAESVDAGMENRRLKRALWLARAEKARFLAMVIDNYPYTQVLHFTSRKRDESGNPLGVARTAMEWWKMLQEVERKCRAKAEQYQ